MIVSHRCPHCKMENPKLEIQLETSIAWSKKVNCIAFVCSGCKAVLSVQIDPVEWQKGTAISDLFAPAQKRHLQKTYPE